MLNLVGRCHPCRAQFFDPTGEAPNTTISGKDFLDFMEAKARVFGRSIQAQYAEGFICSRIPGVGDLFELVWRGYQTSYGIPVNSSKTANQNKIGLRTSEVAVRRRLTQRSLGFRHASKMGFVGGLL